MRRAVTFSEVALVLAMASTVALMFMAALPRWREGARSTSCETNLRAIGQALGQYQSAMERLPWVVLGGQGPLAALAPFAEAGTPLDKRTCPSDRRTANLKAPSSYRAVTGDAPEGGEGPFSPGRPVDSKAIDEGDGATYTAAFEERLVGDGRSGSPAPWNYAVVPGPLDAKSEAPPQAFRGEAGDDAKVAGWPNALATHAVGPNAPRSFVSEEGKSALIGGSSEHVRKVHVLRLDGRVEAASPTIGAEVWKSMATLGAKRFSQAP